MSEHADCHPVTNPKEWTALTINPKVDDEMALTGDKCRKAHSSADADRVVSFLSTWFHINTEANNMDTFADSSVVTDNTLNVEMAAHN